MLGHIPGEPFGFACERGMSQDRFRQRCRVNMVCATGQCLPYGKNASKTYVLFGWENGAVLHGNSLPVLSAELDLPFSPVAMSGTPWPHQTTQHGDCHGVLAQNIGERHVEHQRRFRQTEAFYIQHGEQKLVVLRQKGEGCCHTAHFKP